MTKTIFLGSTGIEVSRIGTGTNRWEKGLNDEKIKETYEVLLDHKVNFFDTAEIYTHGKSEQLLGVCKQNDPRPAVIATKYRPMNNRNTKKDFMDALDASLKRIGIKTIDLYYVHSQPKSQGIDELMDYMAEAHEDGKINSIGVSNFDSNQMTKAAEKLGEYGLPLAANQVEYSLLNRAPEKNGVLDACKTLNVSLIAYRPLAKGKLTSSAMSGSSLGAGDKQMRESDLANKLMNLARDHGGNISQLAINWLIYRDNLIIPIPGSTSVNHALKNIGALDWGMSKTDFDELDEASRYPIT